MAVRADENQVGELGLVAWLELMDGPGVTHLDEAVVDVALTFLERHLETVATQYARFFRKMRSGF